MMLVIDIDTHIFELAKNLLLQADAEVSELTASMGFGMKL